MIAIDTTVKQTDRREDSDWRNSRDPLQKSLFLRQPIRPEPVEGRAEGRFSRKRRPSTGSGRTDETFARRGIV